MEQPKIWDYSLGERAEVNTISNNVVDEGSGSPSFRALFPEITGVPVSNGGQPIKRKDVNALFKIIGEQIFFIQRGGTYSWNYDATYPQGAIIIHNGVYYKALKENTSRDPETDDTSWSKLVEVTKADLDAALSNIELPEGTTLEKGIVQLSSVLSDDESTAVTPKAVKEVLEQITALGTNLSNVETSVESLTNTVSANSSDISDIKTKNLEQDSAILALQNLVGDGNVDFSDIQSQLDSIVEKNNQQDTAIANLQNINNDYQPLKDNVTELQQSLTSQDARITTLETTVQNMSGSGSGDSTLEPRITALESSLQDIITTNNTQDSNILTLESNITNISGDVSNLQSAVEVLQANSDSTLAERVSEIESKASELLGISEYNSTSEYDAHEIVSSNGVLYKSLVDANNFSLNDNTKWQQLKFVDSELETNITNLQSSVSTLETNITNAQSDLSAYSTRLGNAETRIATLENTSSTGTDLTEVNSRLDNLETASSNYDTRITALENANPSDTSNLVSRLETAEESIINLQSDNDSNKTSISDHETRISDLEQNSSKYALSTDLTQLNNTLSSADESLSSRIEVLENAKVPDVGIFKANADETYAKDSIVYDSENDKFYKALVNDANLPFSDTTKWVEKQFSADTSDLEATVSSLSTAVSTNTSNITNLTSRVTTLENSGGSSSSTGGTSYKIYSLDTNNKTASDSDFDDVGSYITYEADSADAITSMVITGTKVEVNINHARSLRRIRLQLSADSLGNPTTSASNPVKISLKYDNADPNDYDLTYDEFNLGWIPPIAQAFLAGDAKRSIQGNATEMSVFKLWWEFELGYPILDVALTTQLNAPLIAIINF